MIPPFDNRGLLPVGVHTATWTETAAYFGADLRRLSLVQNAKAFALTEVAPIFPSCGFFLAGSTLSDKAFPGDIEAFVAVDQTLLAIPANMTAAFSLQARHDAIRAQYEVDFYVSFGLPGAPDFSAFFQYVGEKTAAMKHLHEKDKRGIIEVAQWTLG